MLRSLPRVVVIMLVAALLSGCAAGRAFRRGQEAARTGDWDAAVAHYTRAVQANPDKAEYKISLERAMQMAAREHITRARDLESKDQLDAALLEYRKAVEMDASNRLGAAKVAELEKTIRDRIEASRPKPQIQELMRKAREQATPPLNPASRAPLSLRFTNASLREILDFIGNNSGINITYDQQFVDKPYTVQLNDVTLEQALQQILQANQYYYKVLNDKTIIIIPDTPAKHAQYDELVVRVFYLSHADVTELVQIINTVMRIPQMAVQPAIFPNKTANTVTVRATEPVVNVIERIIRANDKPRAEIVVDVQILEVNRKRTKDLGLNLSSYALGLTFSPELAPPNTSVSPANPPGPPPFNLNTITQGISTADFYLAVPTAVVRFLEQDSHTKQIAKPQLRGAEGTELTLNLGDEIPIVQSVFGSQVPGGLASVPISNYQYRSVGVNIAMTPRVTYEGEIVLDLTVESSSLGASINVGGQEAPTFGSRKVKTRLRLREGESNLLAGLLRDDQRKILTGFPGLLRTPVLRSLFGQTADEVNQTDIVMLLTPHIVRTHQLTAEDLAPIYIGTQQNIGLSGPPPLIAPPPVPEPDPAAAGLGTTGMPPQTSGVPGAPASGVPGPPVAAPFGTQTTTRPAPPGTSPAPSAVSPTVPQPAPITPTAPAVPPTGTIPPGGGVTGVPAGPTGPGGAPPAAGAVPGAPGTAPTPAGTTPAATPGTTPPRDPTQPSPATTSTPPSASVAQIMVTAPRPEFTIAGGPYTVPVSINNASRVSVITLTVTFNPSVLRVRTVQEGTFMRQGGITATFTPRIDAAAGRVDIAITRAGDQTGASGSGLLSALMFDAVGPGSAIIQVSGMASTPEGGAVSVQFNAATVTVR